MSELSVNEILNQLKKTEQLTSIYVPTQQKDIDFKPITLLQQKGIMDKVTVNFLFKNCLFKELFN